MIELSFAQLDGLKERAAPIGVQCPNCSALMRPVTAQVRGRGDHVGWWCTKCGHVWVEGDVPPVRELSGLAAHQAAIANMTPEQKRLMALACLT